MNTKIYHLLTFFIIVAATSAATGQTVKIGSTSYTSIADAITNATDGDVIDITGVHTELVNFNDKSITLRGTDPSTDIIEAAASAGTATDAVVTIFEPTSAINVTIENLGIRYGNKTGSNGGGIMIEKNPGKVTLNNLIIEQNATDKNGGGLSIVASDVDINECTISKNSSSLDGGGLIIATNNGGSANQVVNIKKSLIDSNTGRNGGGIWINGNKGYGDNWLVDVNIENSTISNNNATSGSSGLGGGGILSTCALLTTDNTTSNVTLKMVHCTSYNNTHAAKVKSGLQFQNVGGTTNFSLYNSVVVAADDLTYKAINFANSNTTAVMNCILGGLNSAPTLVNDAASNNTVGKTATYAGFGTSFVNAGGNVKVLKLSNSSPAINYCSASTGQTLPTTDARGTKRQDSAPDAGAYEAGYQVATKTETISSDITVDTMTIRADTIVLTINSSATVEVTGEFVNAGSVVIESGSALAVTGTVSGTGTATVKRNTTGNSGYSIIGAPVSGVDLSTLGANYLYDWNGANWMVPSGTMSSGKGYFVGYDVASPQLSLTGPLVSGNQSVAVTTTGDGFNIVANPYAAAISVKSFLTANSNIDASVYLWDDGGANAGSSRGGDYIIVNNLGSVSGTNNLNDNVNGLKGSAGANNGFIGSTQGFWVHATTNGNVNFTPAMQSTTSGANQDANFYRTATDKSTIKLSLSGDFYNEVLIGFLSDATTGHDQKYDALKLAGNDHFSFYSLMGDQKYGIQGLPELNGEQVIIPLGYHLTTAGTYQLDIKNIEGISDHYQITARYNDQEYDLSAGAAMNLSAGTGTIELILAPQDILSVKKIPQDHTSIYHADGSLHVQTIPDLKSADLRIIDLSGRTVWSKNEQSLINGKWSDGVALPANGVYILRISSGQTMITKKFIY